MMSKAKKVSVTCGDIKRGKRKVMSKCPIAKACNRQFKQKGWRIACHDNIKSPYKKAYRTLAKDADKVDNFIGKFDRGEKVRPITFKLVPAEKDW